MVEWVQQLHASDNRYSPQSSSQLYDGPLVVRSDAVSRQRQYASGYPMPKTRTEDEAAGGPAT